MASTFLWMGSHVYRRLECILLCAKRCCINQKAPNKGQAATYSEQAINAVGRLNVLSVDTERRKVDVQWSLFALVHNIGKIHVFGALT